MNCIGKQAQATNKVYTRLTSPDGGEVCCRDINMRPQGGLTETRLLMFARKCNIDLDSTINTGFADGSVFINVASSNGGVNGNTIVRLANIPASIDAGATPTIPPKIGVSELYTDSQGYVRMRIA